MPSGIPGPHPGTPNKKRKREEDLSENPYTRKSRARTARLTGHDRTMDNARNADRQAVNRRLRKLKASGEYLAADEAAKKRMLSDAVKREIEYR
ncbi:hypothetical protein BDW42DRAFT_121769 [Aspergillus taichungensis]|uniref:Uncharacterized protein n=1 Tax=Aspergillus taichungensis TaxID=482145 RepID=A0A2J5I7N2_9EURO|nr:hypothetical protein BDW42DRAFT_121769 [Aspergillus taichungensis]